MEHLDGKIKITPCFHLLERLKHMDARYRARNNPSTHFIYYKAFIKLLVESQLARLNKTCDHFLFSGGFQPQPTRRKSGRP